MLLYPHWLDGEFVRICSGASGPNQKTLDMIRALKVHALLGTRFVLSDVQVFDSAAVLELFRHKQARKFLKANKDFLDLRVDPASELGETPYALSARGLLRTQSAGWVSSLFVNDPTPVRRLAEEILTQIVKEGNFDLARGSAVLGAYPEERKWLAAIRKAVHHFGAVDTPERLVAAHGERHTYYGYLRRSLERIGPESPDDRRAVEEALEFIDSAIEDPQARNARSRVRSCLDRISDPKKQARVWNTVVQAWNYATQRTLKPEGGSAGWLPGAPSLAPYLDTVTDVLVPVDYASLNLSLLPSVTPVALLCNVDRVSWKAISKVRKETTSTMIALSLARSRGDAQERIDCLQQHVRAVAGVLHPPMKTNPVEFTAKVAGLALATFGGEALTGQRVASFLVGIAGAAAVAWEHSEPWRRRRALAGTLTRIAEGPNP
ncbi:MAG: hypothetical protein IPJ17_08675 [Holophagales bacterium]|nr:MAG: hypothetical protein IPJ17_08675 [Holophagales bacterium]